MKYLLIEHFEGNTPSKVTVCNSHLERLHVTREVVLGPDNGGQTCPQLLDLQETGRATFLGDPPMEWLEANLFFTPSATKTL